MTALRPAETLPETTIRRLAAATASCLGAGLLIACAIGADAEPAAAVRLTVEPAAAAQRQPAMATAAGIPAALPAVYGGPVSSIKPPAGLAAKSSAKGGPITSNVQTESDAAQPASGAVKGGSVRQRPLDDAEAIEAIAEALHHQWADTRTPSNSRAKGE